ncbi:unnamed protein product [Didymodactylos carnosus]|uniref:Uncharacterized protein n=1 Tax=Didymodactylos carnosus TaxID=1234261 RepID=A0A815C0Y6_9BILA|nr:unnamed protein product [Didymodactylos carnosus]CAF4072733.1 unnamed protein product [Didymodactylos carnosus]
MVDYALASHGAGTLIDRDIFETRHWPMSDEVDIKNPYKHCCCTMIMKCPMHEDYTTYKFLITDPLSIEFSLKHPAGKYQIYHELLDRYPHYHLRGSAKTGDTFYRHKEARWNYTPSYRLCSNELFNKQVQWELKRDPKEDAREIRPASAPVLTTSGYLPPLSTKKPTRTYHRNNYFYNMAL